MSEMIDRIVKAMQEIAGEDLNEVKARDLAVATLEEMRVPTEAMFNAGDALRNEIMEYGPDYTRTYQAMIDAALK